MQDLHWSATPLKPDISFEDVIRIVSTFIQRLSRYGKENALIIKKTKQ